jgi:hypothetical protein
MTAARRAPGLKGLRGSIRPAARESLYQRAVGYHYDAVKIFMPAGAKRPVRVPIVEQVPPELKFFG